MAIEQNPTPVRIVGRFRLLPLLSLLVSFILFGGSIHLLTVSNTCHNARQRAESIATVLGPSKEDYLKGVEYWCFSDSVWFRKNEHMRQLWEEFKGVFFI